MGDKAGVRQCATVGIGISYNDVALRGYRRVFIVVFLVILFVVVFFVIVILLLGIVRRRGRRVMLGFRFTAAE